MDYKMRGQVEKRAARDLLQVGKLRDRKLSSSLTIMAAVGVLFWGCLLARLILTNGHGYGADDWIGLYASTFFTFGFGLLTFSFESARLVAVEIRRVELELLKMKAELDALTGRDQHE